MWTYLSTWIVQDGEVPELQVGSLLTDHGIRLSGQVVEPTSKVDGLDLVQQFGPRGFAGAPYRLSGVVEWGRPETWEWLIRCGDLRFIAHLSNVFPAPRGVGDRVSVLGGLSVIPDYEWLSFGLPSVRQNWTVNALKIEHCAVEVRDDHQSFDVVEVEDLAEMHQWTDERPGLSSTYPLDLSPAP